MLFNAIRDAGVDITKVVWLKTERHQTQPFAVFPNGRKCMLSKRASRFALFAEQRIPFHMPVNIRVKLL